MITVKLLKENPLLSTEIDALDLSDIIVGEYNNYGQVQYGRTIDYSSSTVKQVVDAWGNTAVASGDNATARLITYDELMDNLGYNKATGDASHWRVNPEYTPTWVYNSTYGYWTMSQIQVPSGVWRVNNNGDLNNRNISNGNMFRPVLELSKTADISIIN